MSHKTPTTVPLQEQHQPEAALIQWDGGYRKWKMANACVVQPLPRRVRQESANTTTETITAGDYVKITERGSGQYQRFVSVFYS